ncbi:MAG: 50S ribosomal protein L4 [Candidatus Micrarchaeaceae archaeon]
MKAKIYDKEGRQIGEMELPKVFEVEPRIDIIRRALIAEETRELQPQGRFLLAGMQTTANLIKRYNAAWRRGRHIGRPPLPREKLGGGAIGDVKRVPSAKKGRRAHPQKIEKKIYERINKKEYRLAMLNAVGALAKVKVNGLQMPIVIDNSVKSVSKTKEAEKILEKFGFGEEMEKSHRARIRKGHRRSGRIRLFRKFLVVVLDEECPFAKAVRNIPGVNVCFINNLKVKLLVPGAVPRSSLWSENAILNIESAISNIKGI